MSITANHFTFIMGDRNHLHVSITTTPYNLIRSSFLLYSRPEIFVVCLSEYDIYWIYFMYQYNWDTHHFFTDDKATGNNPDHVERSTRDGNFLKLLFSKLIFISFYCEDICCDNELLHSNTFSNTYLSSVTLVN